MSLLEKEVLTLAISGMTQARVVLQGQLAAEGLLNHK